MTTEAEKHPVLSAIRREVVDEELLVYANGPLRITFSDARDVVVALLEKRGELRTCETCRFWRFEEYQTVGPPEKQIQVRVGSCRLTPPVAHPDGSCSVSRSRHNYWCARWDFMTNNERDLDEPVRAGGTD